jgi:hypothetical protein
VCARLAGLAGRGSGGGGGSRQGSTRWNDVLLGELSGQVVPHGCLTSCTMRLLGCQPAKMLTREREDAVEGWWHCCAAHNGTYLLLLRLPACLCASGPAGGQRQ